MATAALVAAALIVPGSQAEAHWQYTRWGMTPPQVIAASEGTAVANANRSLDAEGVRAELTAPYTGSQLKFTATFLFDDRDQLQYVTLAPLAQDSCPAMLKTLTANHGAPQFKDATDYSTTSRWQDLDNNNVVIYFDLGRGNCTIQYSRLPPTRSDGRL